MNGSAFLEHVRRKEQRDYLDVMKAETEEKKKMTAPPSKLLMAAIDDDYEGDVHDTLKNAEDLRRLKRKIQEEKVGTTSMRRNTVSRPPVSVRKLHEEIEEILDYVHDPEHVMEEGEVKKMIQAAVKKEEQMMEIEEREGKEKKERTEWEMGYLEKRRKTVEETEKDMGNWLLVQQQQTGTKAPYPEEEGKKTSSVGNLVSVNDLPFNSSYEAEQQRVATNKRFMEETQKEMNGLSEEREKKRAKTRREQEDETIQYSEKALEVSGIEFTYQFNYPDLSSVGLSWEQARVRAAICDAAYRLILIAVARGGSLPRPLVASINFPMFCVTVVVTPHDLSADSFYARVIFYENEDEDESMSWLSLDEMMTPDFLINIFQTYTMDENGRPKGVGGKAIIVKRVNRFVTDFQMYGVMIPGYDRLKETLRTNLAYKVIRRQADKPAE